MSESIHEFLNSIRIEQQLSIQELSKLSGVSASHISRIERGNRKPSPQTLQKLAPHLTIPYLVLLEVANLIDKSDLENVHLDEVLKHPNIFYDGNPVSENTKKNVYFLLENTKED